MASQYRILCEVHSYQYVWSDELVTTCPIDPADPINADATCITGQLRPAIQLTPIIPKNLSNYLMRVASIMFDVGTNGTLKQVAFFSYGEPGITSYTIEVYDHTNLQSLGTGTFTNTEDYVLNKINISNEMAISPAQVEINLSINSSISGKKVYISQIIFYTF